ncbi:ABC transporter permease [Mesorhizobium sp. CA8]|uniref:ABC transporter permease n=1 Tax=unclassified Mesorhizobium TaxID=325217 RepID=UPI001CC900B5|nr:MULTISPECIES: ABC transporter permease [unclassified Mesorhizobium]MBZ9762395.1 ABC transporter permease [Mesorhizobium sp. CA8]MBZ9819967.1 ABC transporter permease [Mesorhizobium sp. CA4]
MAQRRTAWTRLTTPFANIPASTATTLALAMWVVVIGGWALLSYGRVVPNMFLPTPGTVLETTYRMSLDGSLLYHTLTSAKVVILGFIVSSLIAVPLGLWMGTYRAVQAPLEPLVNFIRYLPVTSFVPLFILWIGIGIEQRIAVIFFGTFFQQLVMISDCARGVSRDLVNASYTLGTKRSEAVWHVIFPAALPAILDTLRVTMGWAWTYLVVAELVAASSGLGYISLKAMRGFQVDVIFMAIAAIGLLGLITDTAFRILRARVAPWAP